MKKYLILLLAVTSLTVVASCEKDSGGVTDPNPRITINEKETVLPPTGGSASIGYEIINPAENGELKAEPTVSWMSGFKVSETRISFAVQANSTGASRPGIIKLTYTYGDSLSTTLDVNVTQETMQEGDVATPIIEFDEDPVIDAKGGKCEITYTVTNPIADARMSAELDTPNDWLSNINCDTDGVITFEVAPNKSTESRLAVINAYYIYGDKSVFKQFSVEQSGVATYEYDMEYMWLKNTGIISYTNGHEFMLKLSDMQIDEFGNLDNKSTGYVLDLYSKENGTVPVAGTYNVDKDNTANPSTVLSSSSHFIQGGNYITFTSGTVTISYEGDNINIVCDLIAEDNSIHNVTYTGIIEIEEEEGISCLTDDYTLNLADASVTYKSEPTFIIPMWQFEFKPQSGNGDGLFIELYAFDDDESSKFPIGNFQNSPDIYSTEGFAPGKVSTYSTSGTMYHRYKNGGISGEWAPAITGELTIADNGDETYTFTFAFVDDKGYTWSGEWTGKVWVAY